MFTLLPQAGLSKLNEATSLVDDLKQKAGEQGALLVQKQAEADTALKDITVAMQVTIVDYWILPVMRIIDVSSNLCFRYNLINIIGYDSTTRHDLDMVMDS